MKNIFSTLIFLFIFLITLNAQQSGASFQGLVNVGTTAPEVASMGKFGNYPVNYNTGTSGITIPVYQINVGSVKLPISFDYNTSGIRVDEVSSTVGLGWAMNGIGMVSRNVVNIPDEDGGGYLSSPSFDSLYQDWAHAGGLYGAAIDNQYSQFLYGTRSQTAETDPDIYSYSINGQSGKFIFKKDRSIMQIPRSNVQIVQFGAGYKIADANGLVYIFDQLEHTQNPGLNQNYVSSWRLSKLVDANSIDTVFFNYETSCGVNTEHFTNYTYSFGSGPDCSGDNTQGEVKTISYQGEKFSNTQINHIDEIFLKEIIWRGGKISFVNTCDRKDKSSEKRLNEVDVYSNVNGVFKRIKTMKLYQSYFYSNVSNYTSTDERNYRLRLDSVAFLPIITGNTANLTYRMTYDTTIQMAGRESSAQDQWGFNNGQFSNYTFMPAQTVYYGNSYYNIGEANRGTDSLSMLSCMIKSIQYPTGGKTVFAFEPHQYPTTTSYTQPRSFNASANGGFQTTSQSIFTPTSLGSAYKMTYNFSSYNYTDGSVTGRPNITITDQTTGEQILLSSNVNPSLSNSNTDTPSPFNAIYGHTYLVVINIYTTTNTNVYARLSINWVETYSNIPIVGVGGGLRTKSITNYDNNGGFINKDIFQYNSAQLLTPSSYLLVNYENTTYKCGQLVGGGCEYRQQSASPYSTVYHANSVFPATQFSGSPVLYGSVTKSQVDSSGNATNGKSIYTYLIYNDQPALATTDYGTMGVLLINSAWKNGNLASELNFKYNSSTSQFNLINEKVNNYVPSRADTMMGLKVKSLYNWNTSTCYIFNMANTNTEYFLAPLPVTSGAMLLQSSSDSTWDTNGNVIVTTENYTYDDLTHLLPTLKQMSNSKGQTIANSMKYPHDFASSGNVYQKMFNRNIISPVVQTIKKNNGNQLLLANTNYSDWLGNSTLLLPQTLDQQVAASPLETRFKFNAYDKYGNILQQQKISDQYNSYIWDYYSTYPVAEVINASQSDIAYSSFEADGTGGFTIPSTARNIASSITGSQSYNLSNGSISKSLLDSSNKYIVSYWSPGGSYSVTGSTTVVTGRSVIKNSVNWTYYQHTVTGRTTLSISGSGNIDELRLYPTKAQMTTYTYDPLIGMTSGSDANNRITYYEYDGLGRLSLVRDQNRNIVKKYCYNYAGQQSSCDNYINTDSTSTAPSNINLTYTNTTSSTVYLRLTNTGSGQVYNFTLSGNTNTNPAAIAGQIPQGTYDAYMYSSSGAVYTYRVYSYSQTGTTYSATNLSLCATCASVSINN